MSHQKMELYTFYMLVNDKVASSLASHIPLINKKHKSQQTDIIQEVVSPEVIKLDQSVCN